jgi:hypothetical protein
MLPETKNAKHRKLLVMFTCLICQKIKKEEPAKMCHRRSDTNRKRQ